MDVFVLGGLQRTGRSCVPDKGHNLRRSSFSSHAVRTYPRIFRMHRLDMAYSSSMSFSPPRYLRETSERRLGRICRANIFHLALSLLGFFLFSSFCFGPFFTRNGTSSNFTRGVFEETRNSRWSTSIFLLKINGYADTRKKKKLYSTLLNFLRSYRTSISSMRSYSIPDESCRVSISSCLFFKWVFIPFWLLYNIIRF